jgi:hypothetical protein
VLETDGKDAELRLVIALGGVTIHTPTFIDLDDVKSLFPLELEPDYTFHSVGVTGALAQTANSHTTKTLTRIAIAQ